MATAPDTTSGRWTIARLLAWTRDYFARQQVDEPRLSAEVLLAHVLDCRRIDLYAHFDSEPNGDKTRRFRELVRRAATHEPIAYLVGEKEFFSLFFYVTPDVLIPRGETETLVERVIEHLRTLKDASSRTFLDVGTGSGCISIAILSQLQGATAVATDISPAALAVAKQNAERHGLTDRIHLVEADRLALPADLVPEGGFDVILSNPPYVAAADLEGLSSNVRDYEPHSALTDHGDGLSFYRSIAADAPNVLRGDGVVFLEIADGRQPSVRRSFTHGGKWVHSGTWRDSVTGHERVMAFVPA